MWENLGPPIIAGLTALLVSLLTAFFLRRSSRESNDTNAFKVVTDQLFALNDELREKVGTLEVDLREVKRQFAEQQKELDQAKTERDAAKRVNAGLAAYIKKLLSAWPTETSPPSPDYPVDWESHLP